VRERKGRIKRWRQSIVVENEIRLCREIKRNVTAFPVGGTARGLPCTREGSHLLHDLREFRAELVEGPLLLEVLAALAPIVRAAVVLLTPFPAVVVGPQSPRRRHAPRGPPPRDAQCPRARRSGHRLPPSLPPRPPPQRTHPHAAHADGALRTARSLSSRPDPPNPTPRYFSLRFLLSNLPPPRNFDIILPINRIRFGDLRKKDRA